MLCKTKEGVTTYITFLTNIFCHILIKIAVKKKTEYLAYKISTIINRFIYILDIFEACFIMYIFRVVNIIPDYIISFISLKLHDVLTFYVLFRVVAC